MSLILERSHNKPEAKIFAENGLKGFMENEIRIGKEYINVEDFASLVLYFFTNTDLEDNDVRLKLKKDIEELYLTQGYNEGNTRLESKETK